MQATVHPLHSTNCRCPGCECQRDAEREARDRHPAGGDITHHPVTSWECYSTGTAVVLDLLAGTIDDEWLSELDHLLSCWREVRDELAGQRLGELTPEDYEHMPLLSCIDDIRDHLRQSLDRPRAIAVSMALQRHVANMEVPNV